MGLILSNDYVTYTPTARSAKTDYPVINITDKWHMLRRFRADDATANDWLIKLDFTTSTIIKILFLRYVNFNSITIQGNDTDVWTSPSFSETVSLTLDDVTNRYTLTHLLTAFEYRYMRLFIPTGQTPISDTVWFIGDVCCFSDYVEFTRNITSYSRTAEIPYSDIKINDRISDRVTFSDHLKFTSTIDFGERVYLYESELLDINAMPCATPVLFFENMGDNEKGWLCLRNTFYKGSRDKISVSSNTLTYEEVGV